MYSPLRKSTLPSPVAQKRSEQSPPTTPPCKHTCGVTETDARVAATPPSPENNLLKPLASLRPPRSPSPQSLTKEPTQPPVPLPKAALVDETIHDVVRSYRIADLREHLKEQPEQVNEPNEEGDTPLHIAARRGAVLVAETLTEFSPNPFANNKEGLTPAYVAALYRHPITAEFLWDRELKLADCHESTWQSPSDVQSKIEAFKTSHADPSTNDISTFVADMTGLETAVLNRPEDTIKNATHLQGLDGTILGVRAEGWWANFFFPQRVRALITALVTQCPLPEAALGGLSTEEAQQRLVEEVALELDALRMSRRGYILSAIDNPTLAKKATELESRHVANRVLDLKEGQEYFLSLGFPGHALYLGLQRSMATIDSGSSRRTSSVITVRIDNLGAGYTMAHEKETETGRVQSRSFNVPLSFLETDEGRELLRDFIQNVMMCDARAESSAEDFYRHVASFKQTLKQTCSKDLVESRSTAARDDAEEPQVVGNCTVENTLRGLRLRLNSPSLFEWFRSFEQALSNQLVELYAQPSALLKNARRKRDTEALRTLVRENRPNLAQKLHDFFAHPTEGEHRADLGENLNADDIKRLITQCDAQSLGEVLLHGAKPDLQGEHDETPLHWAAKTGHETMARLLIVAGAHIDDPDSKGDTPLMWAVRSGADSIVKLLRTHGANPERENKKDETPRDIALAKLTAAFAAYEVLKPPSPIRHAKSL